MIWLVWAIYRLHSIILGLETVRRRSPKKPSMSTTDTMNTQERDLATLIVSSLNLEMDAAEIEPEAPLYKDGLGLDSIDILEIALAISKTYGFQMRSDDSDNIKIFSSLRNLSQHIQTHRTK